MLHLSRYPRFVLLLFLCPAVLSCSSPGNVADKTSPPSDSAQSIAVDSTAQISEYVVSTFEDKDGNLWFGTMSDGVVRYDGKTLRYFSAEDGLCDNVVAGIEQDKDGNMWFGTHNGASRYNGQTFTTFGEKQGLHGAGCKFLIDKDGTLWAGTNHGAFKFNGSSFVEFPLPQPKIDELSYKWEPGKVWDLMQDSKGDIWFARDGFGACKYDGTTFTHYTKQDGLCSNNISRIVEDNQGNIWFACLSSDLPKVVKEGGVCKYDGTSFTKYNEGGLKDNDIYTVYCTKSGDVWMGATGVGAYRYDGKTMTLFANTTRNDLVKNFGVQSVLEDSKGILWFGFSGGLFRFDGSMFVNVTQAGPWK